jgi:hypothetical protein
MAAAAAHFYSSLSQQLVRAAGRGRGHCAAHAEPIKAHHILEQMLGVFNLRRIAKAPP